MPKAIVPYKSYKELEKIEFSGKCYLAVKDYDPYLKTCYGEYMIPPSDSKKQCYTYNSEEYYIEDEYYQPLPRIINPYADEWL